jgi:DNA-binding IclR family transcriptional regulator
MSRQKRVPVYAAPALEKGLDILECLAEQRVPVTQSQLARVLRRSPSELFRMLSCLEQRGYIRKDPVSGAYALTLRLFELSRTHSPYEHLTKAASRPMQALSESVLESCHLSILHGARLLIVAQQESPEKIRLSVEVGGNFSTLSTVSGRLLLSMLPGPELRQTLLLMRGYKTWTAAAKGALEDKLRRIRARKYSEAYSETVRGVYDLAVPVGGGSVRAALTIACLSQDKAHPRHRLLLPLRMCAAEIGATAGLLAGEDQFT